MIERAIVETRRLHGESHETYRELCDRTDTAYSTFMRRHSRMNKGQPAIQRPGPKKIALFDLGVLAAEIKERKHGPKRTSDTNVLYVNFKDQISRRSLREMIVEARQRYWADFRTAMTRVTWHVPGLVWSIDDTEFPDDIFLHQTHDLASKLKFRPLIGEFADGAAVSKNLEELYALHGAPLFQKRDNGGNLNDSAVDAVLEKYYVIPLNSPTYYPQYNGSLEIGQREIKRALAGCDPQKWAEMKIHDLNHRRRGCLGGRTSCECFYSGKSAARQYDRRRRKEVFEKITEMAATILKPDEAHMPLTRTTAWRVSAETWLRKNGVITVSSYGKVLPDFSGIRSHN